MNILNECKKTNTFMHLENKLVVTSEEREGEGIVPICNRYKLLWCWRRLLRVPWTARRSNWSILKKASPEYSLEGLMLKLKLQYYGHLMQRANSLEKILMMVNIEG